MITQIKAEYIKINKNVVENRMSSLHVNCQRQSGNDAVSEQNCGYHTNRNLKTF